MDSLMNKTTGVVKHPHTFPLRIFVVMITDESHLIENHPAIPYM
jgi:hypothetical protein